MSKVTSKLQITLPKALAVQYALKPGSEVSFVPAGESIRLSPTVPPHGGSAADLKTALKLFDEATRRLKKMTRPRSRRASDRGWTRAEIYARGLSR